MKSVKEIINNNKVGKKYYYSSIGEDLVRYQYKINKNDKDIYDVSSLKKDLYTIKILMIIIYFFMGGATLLLIHSIMTS